MTDSRERQATPMCGNLSRLNEAWKRGNDEPYFAEAYCVAEDLGDTSPESIECQRLLLCSTFRVDPKTGDALSVEETTQVARSAR